MSNFASDRPCRIGVAGAGLLGRLCAWHLSRLGHAVSVFDPAPGPAPRHDGQGAAGFTAAGMLSPLAELDAAEPDVTGRGWHSIPRWAAIAAELVAGTAGEPPMARRGSLMVAHGPDLGAARRVLARLDQPMPGQPAWAHPRSLSPAELATLEPDLHGSGGPLHAWLLPGEGHLDTVTMLQGLHDTAPSVRWHWGQHVAATQPGALQLADGSHHRFDLVVDVRGTGARPDAPVRGVRGEVVWLHAPGLQLQRPVRLLHPRHRVYIVPRSGQRVLVGASELETEDRSPMSLRTAVELMAAAHSVIPALAEARILRLDTNLRPALPDNRPQVVVNDGLVRLNGLYRHGWLLAPSVVDEALGRLGCPPLPSAGHEPHPPAAVSASRPRPERLVS